MKVISKSNTKRLVKGAVYEVLKLENLKTPNNFRCSVIIKLNETLSKSFNTKSFALEDGTDLPEINWESDEWKDQTTNWRQGRITHDNIKKGDYVVYNRNSHKGLIFGKKYKVEEVNIVNHKNTWGGNTSHNWTEVQIKVEGSSRFYKSYSFRKCTPQESRDITLNVLFDEETGLEKVDKNVRKIDKYDESTKEQLLIKILLSSMLDSNRNNMSVIEWAIHKIANQYSLKESDFTGLMSYDLITIISKL